MGHKILDVKTDIHEEVEKYFVQLNDAQGPNGFQLSDQVCEDMLAIVDEHFKMIER